MVGGKFSEREYIEGGTTLAGGGRNTGAPHLTHLDTSQPDTPVFHPYMRFFPIKGVTMGFTG